MKAALPVLFLVLAPSVAQAQAWTRDAGDGYVNLSLTRLSGSSFYGLDFQRQQFGSTTYSQTTVGAYAEIGVIDRWLTLTAQGELFRRNALSGEAATFGLGDIQVGAWTGLVTKPFRLTAGVNFGLPTGDARPTPGDEFAGDATAEFNAATLPTGDGEFDIEPAVVAGYSFGGGAWPLRHYATARVGLWVRTGRTENDERFSDGINYRLELGTQIPKPVFERFTFVVRFFGTESFASREDLEFSSSTGLGNGVTFTSAGVELNARIFDQLVASIGADTAFRARSIIRGIPLRFSLAYTF